MTINKSGKNDFYTRLKELKIKDEKGLLSDIEREELIALNAKNDSLNQQGKNELAVTERTLELISEEISLMRIEKQEEKQEIIYKNFLTVIENSKKDVKKLHQGGKITSASIGTILTAMLFIPKDYFQNTYLLSSLSLINEKSSVTANILTLIWIYAISLCSLFWFLAKRNEKRLEIFLSTLESEDNQNKIFENFIKSLGHYKVPFTQTKLNEFILNSFDMNKDRHRNLLFPLSIGKNTHSIQLATESTTKLIIENKLRKNILIEENNGYNVVYTLNIPD